MAKDEPIPVADNTPSDALTERFLKLSGYKADQITGGRADAMVFTTDNGGKYKLDKKGTVLTTLLGPDYPKAKASEGEDRED